MERPPLYPDASGEMLSDVSTFLRALPDSDTIYSDMCVFSTDMGIRCSTGLKRRDTSAVRSSAITNSRTALSPALSIVERSAVLELCRIMVACPSWTQGNSVFRDHQLPRKPGSEYFALCFSRNSVLKSCPLAVDNFNLCSTQTWDTDPEQWKIDCEQRETALWPFITSSKSEANVAIKELVLEIDSFWSSESLQPPCGEALTSRVHHNATLEKLVLRGLRFKSYRSLAKALAVNHSLKEFGCVCGDTLTLKEEFGFFSHKCVASDLEKLFSVFIPNSTGRIQANTLLTALKLFPTAMCRPKDYMKEVCIMLEFNSTLQHVEIGNGDHFNCMWLKRISPGMLESMVRNALRLNTSLQSLQVLSYCTLLRVGDEWQMSYDGPCVCP